MSRVVRKPAFCICENKNADQLRSLISAFVFTTRIVQSLFFINPEFQVSSHLLWLCSLVCVGSGRKPRRPVFSQRGSYCLICSSEKLPFFLRSYFPQCGNLHNLSPSMEIVPNFTYRNTFRRCLPMKRTILALSLLTTSPPSRGISFHPAMPCHNPPPPPTAGNMTSA